MEDTTVLITELVDITNSFCDAVKDIIPDTQNIKNLLSEIVVLHTHFLEGRKSFKY